MPEPGYQKKVWRDARGWNWRVRTKSARSFASGHALASRREANDHVRIAIEAHEAELEANWRTVKGRR